MSSYDVVGDWGTSRLRLFRMEQGQVTARRDGPGIAEAGANAAQAFAQTIAPWLEDGTPGSIRPAIGCSPSSKTRASSRIAW